MNASEKPSRRSRPPPWRRVGEADELPRAMARYHLAEVDWLTGKLTDSEREMSAILAEWANSDEWLVLLRVGLDLGAVQRAQGRLGAALNTYRRLESKAGTTASALAGMAQVGAAIVFYERDELAEAAAQAAAGVERCRRLVYGPPLVTGLITLARIRLALGDPAGAHAAITEAETAMPGIGDQRVPLGPRRAEVMLATGNVAEAVNWVRDRGLAVDDEPVYPRDEAYAVLARVLIATGDPAPVVPMLERWRVVAEAQGRVAHVLAGQVLQAVAHAALGNEPAALAVLARALTLAAPEGYLRLFLNEGAVVADLLRTLLIGRRLESLAGPEKVPRAFLTRLCAAFERQGTPVLPAAPSGAVAAPGLVVPLSRREQEVLGLVAAGKPNQAIARELFIGLDTVKRHVSHLFVKLEVSNRTEAVPAPVRSVLLADTPSGRAERAPSLQRAMPADTSHSCGPPRGHARDGRVGDQRPGQQPSGLRAGRQPGRRRGVDGGRRRVADVRRAPSGRPRHLPPGSRRGRLRADAARRRRTLSRWSTSSGGSPTSAGGGWVAITRCRSCRVRRPWWCSRPAAEVLGAQRLRSCFFALRGADALVPVAFHGRAEQPRTTFTRGSALGDFALDPVRERREEPCSARTCRPGRRRAGSRAATPTARSWPYRWPPRPARSGY